MHSPPNPRFRPSMAHCSRLENTQSMPLLSPPDAPGIVYVLLGLSSSECRQRRAQCQSGDYRLVHICILLLFLRLLGAILRRGQQAEAFNGSALFSSRLLQLGRASINRNDVTALTANILNANSLMPAGSKLSSV
jgi:hypothetical protein